MFKEQALEMYCSSFFMWEALFMCMSRSEDSYLSWSFPFIGGSWDGSPVFSLCSNSLHLLADLDHSFRGHLVLEAFSEAHEALSCTI